VEDVQRKIEALSSPTRREILWRVWNAELPAGAIAAVFDLAAPTISAHLRVLKEAGLVTARAAGTFRYYRADHAALDAVRPLLQPAPGRWEPADSLPELAATSSRRRLVVAVSVALPVTAADAFRAMTDPVLFSRWLGVEVTIEHGVLACEMEWGTRVRGTYVHLLEPHFVHFTWDAEDGDTPAPGAELPAYLHFTPAGRRASTVEVHQVVDDDEQAAFMDVAWGMVLGRLREGVASALRGPGEGRRARRPKRTTAR
jgi:DNA-binding transcriptional ArsR family regulator